MTDFDGKCLLNFGQRGIGSFRYEVWQKFVMGFEFWFGSGFRFEGVDGTGVSELSFEFSDE